MNVTVNVPIWDRDHLQKLGMHVVFELKNIRHGSVEVEATAVNLQGKHFIGNYIMFPNESLTIDLPIVVIPS